MGQSTFYSVHTGGGEHFAHCSSCRCTNENTNTKDKYKDIQEEVNTAQELQELRVYTLLSTGGNMLLAVARSTGVAGVTRVQEKVCSVLKLTHCGKMSLAVTGAPLWRAVTRVIGVQEEVCSVLGCLHSLW